MSISYPLAFPTNKSPSRITLYADIAVAISESPYTFASQIQEHPGQRWVAEVTLPIMVRADAEVWMAWFLALNGPTGTFLMGDPLAPSPKGVATGSPVVNGGSQSGKTLVTDGWTHSVTGIVKAGDKFQLGQRLYMVTTDANSDSSGNATLDIWPRLRESPADNDTLDFTSPQGLFRLSDTRIPIGQLAGTQDNPLYGLQFTCIEAL